MSKRECRHQWRVASMSPIISNPNMSNHDVVHLGFQCISCKKFAQGSCVIEEMGK